MIEEVHEEEAELVLSKEFVSNTSPKGSNVAKRTSSNANDAINEKRCRF